MVSFQTEKQRSLFSAKRASGDAQWFVRVILAAGGYAS